MIADYLRMTPDSIWWGVISGASRLVADICEALLSKKKSVCLLTSSGAPFRSELFRRVADSIRETEYDFTFEDTIEFDRGGAENPASPGAYLIERHSDPADYRNTMDAAEYLRRSGALFNKFLTVAARSEEAKSWTRFINSYKSATLGDGLFLLIAENYTPINKSLKHVHFIRYENYITVYDALLFAGLLSDGADLSSEIRRYISSLAVALLGDNAEKIVGFIQSYKENRRPDESMTALEPAELERRYWIAQSQELFPLIMVETKSFVDAWRRRIEESLDYVLESRDYPNSPFPEGLRTPYDEPVNSIDELELATIKYLMRKRRVDKQGAMTDEYALFIPDSDARERVDLLYRMRNLIAHGKACDAEDVSALLRY